MLSSVLRKMAIASRDSARLDSDMLIWAPASWVAINAACLSRQTSNIPVHTVQVSDECNGPLVTDLSTGTDPHRHTPGTHSHTQTPTEQGRRGQARQAHEAFRTRPTDLPAPSEQASSSAVACVLSKSKKTVM